MELASTRIVAVELSWDVGRAVLQRVHCGPRLGVCSRVVLVLSLSDIHHHARIRTPFVEQWTELAPRWWTRKEEGLRGRLHLLLVHGGAHVA